VLDQQVAIARPAAEQRGHLGVRGRVELAPLVKRGRTPAAGAGRYPALIRLVVSGISHRGSFLSVTLGMERKDTSLAKRGQ